MTFCFFLMLFAGNEPWTIHVEIFQSLIKPDPAIAVNDAGHVFIVDSAEKKGYHFDSDGKALPNFANPGSGPGEFKQYPTSIHIADKKIFVNEPFVKRMHVFKDSGEYIETLVYQGFATEPFPHNDGWIYLDDFNGETATLYTADYRFEQKKQLAQWEIPQSREGHILVGKERSRLTSSPGGETIYAYGCGTDKLLIIKEGKIVEKRPIPLPLIDFDKDWGSTSFSKYNKRITGRLKPQYPDYFPRVGKLNVDPGGNLWVYSGSIVVNPEAKHLVYSPEGEIIQPKEHYDERVVALVGDVAYVTFYDDAEEEGAAVATMPLKDVSAFLAKLPKN